MGRLIELLRGERIAVAPGAYDAWTARLIEEAGFPLVYATGAGIANTQLGQPDIGLVTMSEMVQQVERITDAVAVPVLADADTGFGGVANIARTVRAYERAGVAGLHIEDQTFPKRCGHFEGKNVIETHEMLLRLEAALEARRSSEFAIVARTDARAIEGLNGAITRARAYAALGVDAVFVEAPQSVVELRRIREAVPDVPLVANMVEGGKTPLLTTVELERLGYSLVLYANFALRIAAFAVRDGLGKLQASGTSRGMLEQMFSWGERQELVRLSAAEAFERTLIEKGKPRTLM